MDNYFKNHTYKGFLSTSNMLLTVKVLLCSVIAISSTIAIKSTYPLVLHNLPKIWINLTSWLKPPYLYILLNSIIIVIAATSRSQRYEDQSQPKNMCEYETEPEEVSEEKTESEEVFEEKTQPIFTGLSEVERELMQQPETEKPLVSSRFSHRKSLMRTSQEGAKSLRVAKVKRQETLESTWKKITEGRHVPLTRHLNKLDTWQHQNRGSESPVHQNIKKALEPSLSQDELNRRVEAFIKKINEEMRLQREKSLQQYMEMISRGV